MAGNRTRVPRDLPSHVTHGVSGYSHYRCGCDVCRTAAVRAGNETRHRLYDERVRRRGRWVHLRAPHGTITGYSTYGCRCLPCTAALTEYRREQRARARARAHRDRGTETSENQQP